MSIYGLNTNKSLTARFIDSTISCLDFYGACIVFGFLIGFVNAILLDQCFRVFNYQTSLDFHLLYLTMIVITNSLAAGVLGFYLKSKNFRLEPLFQVESIFYGTTSSCMFFIILYGNVNYAIVINGSLLFFVLGTAFYFLGMKLISTILRKSSKRLLNFEAALQARNAIKQNELQNQNISKE